MKQSEIIKNLSDKELLVQLYLSQALIFALAIIGGFFFIGNWFTLIFWDSTQIVLFGILPALFIVFVDILLMRILSKKYYDDGGINERIFKKRTFVEIIAIVLVVSVSEEMLFRGVIHTTFGFFIGSFAFALVHVRYLLKPVLLISILFVSFLIGYMYEITDNLLVTIVAHFLVDFLLALFIKFDRGEAVDI